MNLEDYLDHYLATENELKAQYGELAYYSRPVVYEKKDQLLPVAPWGGYAGDPLILPHPDFVDLIAVTAVDPEGRTQTFVRYLADVVESLAKKFPVEYVDSPVMHVVVRIPYDSEVQENLYESLLALPEVSA